MAQRRRFSSFSEIADAMFPTLSREAKQREAAQAREKELREQDRQRLLRGLRELRESLRADRERGRR
jgi:hypothetical protein